MKNVFKKNGKKDIFTMVGTAINMRGIFRPNWQVINPKKKFPINPPIELTDAIQLASSIDIGPVGKGDSIDVNR